MSSRDSVVFTPSRARARVIRYKLRSFSFSLLGLNACSGRPRACPFRRSRRFQRDTLVSVRRPFPVNGVMFHPRVVSLGFRTSNAVCVHAAAFRPVAGQATGRSRGRPVPGVKITWSPLERVNLVIFWLFLLGFPRVFSSGGGFVV